MNISRNSIVRNSFSFIFMAVIMMACSLSTSSPEATAAPSVNQPQTAGLQTPEFQVITIPLGLDPNEPYQMPPYYLETGEGHYLLYLFDAKKLIYDGREIYSGELAGLGAEGAALSQNGLHYAYVVLSARGGNFHDLVIDGNLVTTEEYLANPSVTDDGQHYFYTGCMSGTGFSGSCLFKDGKDIFISSNGFLGYSISRNGNAYLAYARNFDANGAFFESVILNGIPVYEGSALVDKKFSPNGAHYAYVSLDENHVQHLIVDGNEQLSSDALGLLQITDQGSVCTWDSAGSRVVINTTQIPVTHEQIRCYLTDDASHYLIRDGDWFLDGQPFQFSGVGPNDKIWHAELTDQGWYLYRLVN